MRPLLLLLPLALAACNGKGTSVSIDVDGDDNSSFTMDNGTVAVNGTDFKAKFKVPQIKVTAENFDLNGVKLYPGSTLGSFNISGQDKPGGKDEGKVSASFASPAALDKVQGWFRDQLTEQDFKFTAQGSGFAGTTDDGDPFTLDLSADGDGKTKGRIEVRGS
ncbi:hypothetical protein P6144_06455 [Sphingomonas sp. HITSZ_GF]|uniref:hypothetical protein n=1 Tax=Sphingomonas sp. HITSZ_GF TaxID=3037247 RepID=UPI00240E2D83|nr:hypothetical protein [Sphingomonas sp. HITSZ_GF]MDG2533281.1 hypothetical protein [Sphingomonas sp. HITSZ_GF]